VRVGEGGRGQTNISMSHRTTASKLLYKIISRSRSCGDVPDISNIESSEVCGTN